MERRLDKRNGSVPIHWEEPQISVHDRSRRHLPSGRRGTQSTCVQAVAATDRNRWCDPKRDRTTHGSRGSEKVADVHPVDVTKDPLDTWKEGSGRSRRAEGRNVQRIKDKMVHRQTASRGGRKGKWSRFDALLLVAEERENKRKVDEMTTRYDTVPKTQAKPSPIISVHESNHERMKIAAKNERKQDVRDGTTGHENASMHKTTEETKHKQKIVAAEKKLGANHPDVGKAILELGMYYNAAGDMVHAHRCFQRSWQILSQHGPGSQSMEDKSTGPVGAILGAQHGNQVYPAAVSKEELDASPTPSSPCCVELSSSDLVHSVSQLVI